MGRYTIEDKYNIYKGKELIKYNGEIKIFFEVVGYLKDTKTLIGRLRKNSGLTGHFKEPQNCDFIDNHKEGSNYIYVSIESIEKYPNLKKITKRKSYKELDEIDFQI